MSEIGSYLATRGILSGSRVRRKLVPSHDWRWPLAAAGLDQMELQPGTQSRSLQQQQLGEITTKGRASLWCNHASQAGLSGRGSGARGTGERTRLRASAVAFWRRKQERDAAGEVPQRLNFAAAVSVQMKDKMRVSQHRKHSAQLIAASKAPGVRLASFRASVACAVAVLVFSYSDSRWTAIAWRTSNHTNASVEHAMPHTPRERQHTQVRGLSFDGLGYWRFHRLGTQAWPALRQSGADLRPGQSEDTRRRAWRGNKETRNF
ncbi:hypothetical protein PWT90_04092 [Aphanocladium album]|nr:hypothetical protein PWT90_04092 [Aphanocladium album]